MYFVVTSMCAMDSKASTSKESTRGSVWIKWCSRFCSSLESTTTRCSTSLSPSPFFLYSILESSSLGNTHQDTNEFLEANHTLILISLHFPKDKPLPLPKLSSSAIYIYMFDLLSLKDGHTLDLDFLFFNFKFFNLYKIDVKKLMIWE